MVADIKTFVVKLKDLQTRMYGRQDAYANGYNRAMEAVIAAVEEAGIL